MNDLGGRPLAGVALLLSLTGCVSGGPDERDPVPPEEDPVGRRWLTREPLPDCGRLDVDQGAGWRETDPSVFDCFDEALDNGTKAELAVVYPTIEGDPIRAWYRLTGDGMEIYEDTSADSFGGDSAWLFLTCDIPDRLPRRGFPDCG